MGTASAEQRGGKGNAASGGGASNGVSPNNSIYDQASTAYTGSLDAFNNIINQAGRTANQGYDPKTISSMATYTPNTYDPSTYRANTYNASKYSAAGYDAAKSSGATAADPRKIASGIDRYMSPYTDDVIDTTLQDIERTRGIQQNQNAGNAASAGAFGGSRHGLVEAETNRAALDTSAQTAAQLRDTGFGRAAELAGIDISNLQQNEQFNAQMTQANNQFNAAAENAQREFNAGNLDAARRYEAEANNIAKNFNTAAKNMASQYNSTARNTARATNTAAQNEAKMFNTGNKNTRQVLNMDAVNQAKRDEFMAKMGLVDPALGAATGLGNLAQMGVNIGNSITGQQSQQGQLAQNLTQAILNSGQNMFQNYTDSPKDALNTMLAALGLNPATKTGTTSGSSTTTTNASPLSMILGGLSGVGQTASVLGGK